MASLAVKLDLPPGATRAVTFLLAWHFPNRCTWTPKERLQGRLLRCPATGLATTTPRSTWMPGTWPSGSPRAWASWKQRHGRLRAAPSASSDLPEEVKEAALFNLSTLRSQTCFRTADGRFYGWEGCGDTRGCCHGSCTHVWNYEQATAFLFGDLAKIMREVEFGQRHRATTG